MNTRIKVLIASMLAVTLFASCAKKSTAPEILPEEPDAPIAESISPTVTHDEPVAAPDTPEGKLLHPLYDEMKEFWSRIDGSTATIPLTAALYKAIDGGSQPPVHNTTPDAYRRLICNEETDLIFVTYPSENELQMAMENNMELEIIPVTKDALVFLVNVNNPVYSVSLAQLRNVYEGKTTSWHDLGGLRENIVAYQRPIDSGSQTLFLKHVMDGLQPMEPPNEWVIKEMAGLVESISNYDNSLYSIGYSMFYYVNNMYGNSRFKLLGIDGVTPTRDTITNGEYPLEDHYYAVMLKGTPEESPARKLVDWLVSDDGQALVIRAGYIPLRPIIGVLPDNDIDPIYLGDVDNSSGTGGKDLKTSIDDVLPKNGVRPPLSDLFYDGFNYIRYINERILADLTWFDYDSWEVITWLEQYQKRPFFGVPNDYPNYEIRYMGSLLITLPSDNPFFAQGKNFYIYLTEDISPYGQGIPLGFTETYHYDRRVLPMADLFTVRISIPDNPDVSKSINEQLSAWTDSFPNSDVSLTLYDSFRNWSIIKGLDDANNSIAYQFIPVVGLWGNYLSISYILDSGDIAYIVDYVACTMSFDVRTGDVVDMVSLIPDNLDYSAASNIYPRANIYLLTEESLNPEWPPLGYIPDAGSEITAVCSMNNDLHIYLTEPNGRLLEAVFRNESR